MTDENIPTPPAPPSRRPSGSSFPRTPKAPPELPVPVPAEPVDHSVPYPNAPDVDHSDPDQEHYRGAKDPELAKK